VLLGWPRSRIFRKISTLVLCKDFSSVFASLFFLGSVKQEFEICNPKIGHDQFCGMPIWKLFPLAYRVYRGFADARASG
jgi:hypothetical protein